jgi:hypothetical protein
MDRMDDYIEDAMDEFVTNPDLFVEALSQQRDEKLEALGQALRDGRKDDVYTILEDIMENYFRERAWKKADERMQDYMADVADRCYDMQRDRDMGI